MFAAFGAPIKESFQSNNQEEVEGEDNTTTSYSVSSCVDISVDGDYTTNISGFDPNLITESENGLFYPRNLCNVPTEAVEEETESEDDDPEMAQSNQDENGELEVEKQNSQANNAQAEEETSDEEEEGEPADEEEEETESSTKQVVEDDEAEAEDEDEEDEDEEDEVPTTTTGVETFFGGKIEHFANSSSESNSLLSTNVLLKALMMTCLFYVLAHNDTRKYLLKTVFKSISEKYYLYGAMVIFFVLYYLINLFL
jgi:DNA mismatch repair ATPase MutL